MNVEHPLSKLALDKWYKVMIAASAFVFILAITGFVTAVPPAPTAIVSLGCFFWGIGEWINHPIQMGITTIPVYGIATTTSYTRRARLSGITFDAIGFALIGFGIFKFFAHA